MQAETFTGLLSMLISLGICATMKNRRTDLLNQEFDPAGDLSQKRRGTGRLEASESIGQLEKLLTIALHLSTKESIRFQRSLKGV